MDPNPFAAPQSSLDSADHATFPTKTGSQETNPPFHLLALFPLVFGAIGLAGYLVAALVIESAVLPNLAPPVKAYGAQFAMLSLPLSTLIGTAAGIAIAFLAAGRRRTAISGMIFVSLLGSYQAYSLWSQDGIGKCSSAVVLYYPIFGLCSIIAALAFILMLLPVFIPTRSVAG